MEVCFLKIGKPAYLEYSALVAEYLKRLERIARIELREIKESENPEKTEKAVLKAVGDSTLICMDEQGERKSSQAIAQSLRAFQNDPRIKRICFAIGGPYGLHENVLKTASQKWRLSDCTLTSDMAWLLTVEQVYRGFMILAGSGYHHA